MNESSALRVGRLITRRRILEALYDGLNIMSFRSLNKMLILTDRLATSIVAHDNCYRVEELND